MAVFSMGGLSVTSSCKTPLKRERLTPLSVGEVSYYLLELEFVNKCSPERYTLHWLESRVDVAGFWCASSDDRHISTNWGPRRAGSRTASGMPLASIWSTSGHNRLCMAHDDPATPTAFRVGAYEEDGGMDICVDFFTALTQEMSSYRAVLRFDRRRDIPFHRALSDVRDWWREGGWREAYVPDPARLPMYSTWYSYHQVLDADALLEECRLAKPYGMDTVIIDDGWQTDDNNRGYARCGDWQVTPTKFPDMRAFVDGVHALGMKVMLWYSIPFIGEKSKICPRFKGKYLSYNPTLGAYVLDPRFKEVRDYLVSTYLTAVEAFDLDGLKLDFVDAMGLTSESSTDYAAMDCISLEEGVKRLLSEVGRRLTEKNPDFLIEYRQSYVGPIVGSYGNMFRVGDCPSDPIRHKMRALDLRFTSGTTAVHSDMITWHREETVEAAARQLWCTAFAVPQISVRLAQINEEHRALLSHYLSFWRAHRETLLDGALSVTDPQAGYTSATAQAEKESITVLFARLPLSPATDAPHYIVNASAHDGVILTLAEGAAYEIFSPTGHSLSRGTLTAGTHALPVPDAGMILLS